MLKIEEGQTVTCVACGATATHKDFTADNLRMHKLKDGSILCECCHEDYLDSLEDDR